MVLEFRLELVCSISVAGLDFERSDEEYQKGFSQMQKCANISKRANEWVRDKGTETKRWGDGSACQSLAV